MTDLGGGIVCSLSIRDYLYVKEYGPIVSQKKKWERYKKDPEFLFQGTE